VGIYFRRDTRTWWISFTYKGKRLREGAGPEKADAEILLGQRRREMANGKLRLEAPAMLNVEKASTMYLHWFERMRRSGQREHRLVKNLLVFFGDLLLDEITAADVAEYQRRRLSGELKFGHVKAGMSTVNREVSCLRRMLNWAVRKDLVSQNPIQGKIDMLPEPEPRDRYLTPEEAQRLVSMCVPHLEPLVILGLQTGMRLGEVIGLRGAEGDLRANVVRLPGKRTKDADKRIVPLNGEALAVLVLAQGKRLAGCDLVFHRDGRTLGSIRNAFLGACRRAGIKGVTFHTLRHTFCSWCVQAGISLQVVGEIVGHSTIYMTVRYAHLAPSQKVSAVNLVEQTYKGAKPEKNTDGVTAQSHEARKVA